MSESTNVCDPSDSSDSPNDVTPLLIIIIVTIFTSFETPFSLLGHMYPADPLGFPPKGERVKCNLARALPHGLGHGGHRLIVYNSKCRHQSRLGLIL